MSQFGKQTIQEHPSKKSALQQKSGQERPVQNKQYQTLQVIDNVLNQILGQEATQIIYKYLESTYHIQKHEIIEKLDSFNCALEEYLGAGATIIEKIIMQSLEIRVPKENKYFDLVEPPKRLESA